ncbi:MAG TPA: hypothetical protein VKY89_12560 [Thermoanaerobaculia bacterium]|nr:hypothetical protein [Thermoanaerobaculia bacterium]
MRLRLHLSWLFLLGGLIWGASTFAAAHRGPAAARVVAVLTYGYVVWALYWGVPAFWRFWRLHSYRLAGALGGLPFPFRWAVTASLLVCGAYFASVFGGGLLEFFRCLRGLRGQA